MIYNGLALMACVAPGLAGVLYQLHHLAVEGYHDLLRTHPFSPPRSPVERRHLRKPCADCSMIAELVTTRLVSRS